MENSTGGFKNGDVTGRHINETSSSADEVIDADVQCRFNHGLNWPLARGPQLQGAPGANSQVFYCAQYFNHSFLYIKRKTLLDKLKPPSIARQALTAILLAFLHLLNWFNEGNKVMQNSFDFLYLARS